MKFQRRNESIIEIEQVDELLEEGTTLPVKCRLASGVSAVVKYPKNPFGERVLINEFIGACISDLMGLTIPRYGICNLSADIIENTNLNEEINKQNAGLAFYTEYHAKVIPVSPVIMLSMVENRETERIILYDHIVNNYDRHNGNLFIESTSAVKLYLIDNSHIITTDVYQSVDEGMTLASEITSNIINNNNDIYADLCKYVGYSEKTLNNVCSEAKEILTEQTLEDIKNNIPYVWIESYGPENVDKLLKIVHNRISKIDEIKRLIVEEGRKRKWKSC